MKDDPEVLAKVLNARIRNRPVALVGNASSVLSGRDGAHIDRHCVVRMNAGAPTKPVAQGRRIDIHCFSTWSSFQDNLRRAASDSAGPDFFDRAQRVWMSAADRDPAACPDCQFYPLQMWNDLADRLGARPSVGAMVVDMFATLVDVDATLFGFDFKHSGTFYRAKQNRGAHDWESERRFVLQTVEEKGWTIREPRNRFRSLAARVARAVQRTRSGAT